MYNVKNKCASVTMWKLQLNGLTAYPLSNCINWDNQYLILHAIVHVYQNTDTTNVTTKYSRIETDSELTSIQFKWNNLLTKKWL